MPTRLSLPFQQFLSVWYNLANYVHVSGSGHNANHSVMSDSAYPRTVANQAPLSMGFSRQESWSGLPFSASGDLTNLGIGRASVASPALQVDFFYHWVIGDIYTHCCTANLYKCYILHDWNPNPLSNNSPNLPLHSPLQLWLYFMFPWIWLI